MKKPLIIFLALGGLTAWADIAVDPAQFDNLQGKVHRGDLGRSGVFNATGVTQAPAQRWKFQTGAAIKSSPVVVDGVAYFGSHDGAVYAVNATSGALIWSNQTGGKVSGSAAVVSNTVFIASENGRLYALNATNGATKWSVLIESGKVPAGSPAVAYGVVFIGAGSQFGYRALAMSAGYIYGYSMTNGAQVWKSLVNSGPQGYAAIALDSTNLYAGIGGSGYGAFRLTTGATLWSQEQGKQNRQFNSMSVVNGTVFFPGAIRGSVSRYTPGGTKSWLSTTLAQNDDEGYFEMNSGGLFGYEILTDVAVANGLVYAGCNDGRLCTFAQTTGARGWSFQTSGKVQSSPSIASNIVYFGSWDGKVYAVNATNGSEVWNYDLGARIISSPWPAAGAVYVGCDDGALYCLEEAGLQIRVSSTSVSVPEGSTNAFSVRLNNDPVTPLTVTVSRVSGDTDITVQSGASLVFNSGNWANYQAVTLAAAQDADASSDSAVIRCSSVSTPDRDVTAVEVDDDMGLQLSVTELSVAEGSNALYQVHLTAAPSAPVTVTTARVSGDTDLTVSNGAALVFTTGNWSSWQSVTLAAAQDVDMINGTAVFRSSLSGAPSVDLTATEQDEDALGILTDVSAVTVPEGSTGTFQVKLSHLPVSSVTVTVSRVAGDADITVTGGATLAFTTGNWANYQAVTLSAAQDADYLDSTATIRCSASGVPSADITATENDDEFDPVYSSPWSETFENSGSNAGTPGTVNGQHGWTAAGTNALVQTNVFHGGSQALSITGTTVSHTFVDSLNKVWVSYWIRPVLSPGAPLSIATNASAVFYVNTNSQIVAYDSTNAIVVSVAMVSNGWNKIEIYCDYGSRVWNLSLNSTAVVTNFDFYAAPSAFQGMDFGNSSTNLSYLDDINVSATQGAADSDGDGIPDSWEEQYFGGPTNADPVADPDLDGQSNLDEYITGMNPTNAVSRFQINRLNTATLNKVLEWQGVSGRLYTVYWSTNLLNGFQLLESNVQWTGSIYTDSVHSAVRAGFYQIKVELAP